MTTYLNGGRGWLADAAAASIHRMDAAYGGYVPINSAGRSYAEQAEAYRKYLNGTGSLALPPGTSIHETGRAVDFGNSAYGWLGAWDGVGWHGNTQNSFGWVRTVPSEVWHSEYEGSGSPAGGEVNLDSNWIRIVQEKLNRLGYGLDTDGDLGEKTRAAVADFQNVHGLEIDGIPGPITNAKLDEVLNAQSQWPARTLYGETWVKAIQNKLNRLNYGPLEEDGYDGLSTQSAVKNFQTSVGLFADGVAGPITNNKLDDALTPANVGKNLTDRPTLDIQKLVGATILDGSYGPETTAKVIEWQKSKGLTPDGVWGPASDAVGFPATPVTEWPVSGFNATTRPVEDIQKLVGVDADGAYGPLTSQAVAKWQSTRKDTDGTPLGADGIWGPASDRVGFPGVALPPPVVTAPDATYGKKIPTYPGASWADVSPNKSVRTGTVKYFFVHHAADPRPKQEQIDRFMVANDRNVSPNWFIGKDGTASEIVPPDNYRAWTTGEPDHEAVTVETQNTTGAETWGTSPESHEAIAQLIAWASDRYKFPIDRDHVKGHREVISPVTGKPYATACPGPSLYPALDSIVNRAKDIFVEKYADTPPVVTPPTPSTKVEVERAWLEGLGNEFADMADEIVQILNNKKL